MFFIFREKQKSEAKDRKVLEILQVKDSKIQEMEQVGVLIKNSKNYCISFRW
jgi:centlein